MFTLISATPSPFARKVRIALVEKNLPFSLKTEVPWNSDTITPQFNPLEKLPILILPDGSSVYESHHILHYLELKFPDTPLLPEHIDDKLAALQLEVLCDGICDAVVLTLFEKTRGDGASTAWLARQRRKIEGGVAAMNKLVAGHAWAVADRFSLGDIAVGTAVGYLSVRFAELPWRTLYPELAGLSDRLETRASFHQSVPVAQIITDKVM